jgi:hypothetical protein
MPHPTLFSSIRLAPRSRAFIPRGFVLLIASFAIAGSCTPSNIHDQAIPVKAIVQAGLPPLDYREHMRRRFNAERQKDMESDSKKLLQLTADLNSEIAAGGADTSALELHNLDQIQKLAHRVKIRMNLVLVDGRPL